jgi:hypothetical protein
MSDDDWENSDDEDESGGFGALTLDEPKAGGGDKVWSDEEEEDGGEVAGAAPPPPGKAKKAVRAAPKAKDVKKAKIAAMREAEKAKAAERAARRARLNPTLNEAELQRKAESGDREAQQLVTTLEDQDLFLDSAGLGEFARTGAVDDENAGTGAASLHGSNPDFMGTVEQTAAAAGGGDGVGPSAQVIFAQGLDMLELEEEEQVVEFAKLVANKCKVMGTTDHVMLLVKTILREVEPLLVSDDYRTLGTTCNTQRTKLQKDERAKMKGKKKKKAGGKKKAVIKMSSSSIDDGSYGGGYADEYADFM